MAFDRKDSVVLPGECGYYSDVELKPWHWWHYLVGRVKIIRYWQGDKVVGWGFGWGVIKTDNEPH